MFVHLHCHSAYSFLRGVASPEELVAQAAEEKMPAVALTDTNGVYAAVPFYQAARAAGVKPIVGVVLDVEERKTEGGIPRAGYFSPRNDRQRQCGSLVLLAADAEGYSNLCRLVTRQQLPAHKTFRLNGADAAKQDDATAATQE